MISDQQAIPRLNDDYRFPRGKYATISAAASSCSAASHQDNKWAACRVVPELRIEGGTA
jgi:hypothetical protein